MGCGGSENDMELLYLVGHSHFYGCYSSPIISLSIYFFLVFFCFYTFNLSLLVLILTTILNIVYFLTSRKFVNVAVVSHEDLIDFIGLVCTVYLLRTRKNINASCLFLLIIIIISLVNDQTHCCRRRFEICFMKMFKLFFFCFKKIQNETDDKVKETLMEEYKKQKVGSVFLFFVLYEMIVSVFRNHSV